MSFSAGTPGYSGGLGYYRRSVIFQMASAEFTPFATGNDLGSLKVVPYDPAFNGNSVSIAWTVVSILLRVETAATSGSTSVKIARSTGTGVFTNAGYLNNTTALTVPSGVYEQYQFTSGLDVTTVNSGDKLMANYTALGTGAVGFTLMMVLRY